jgi:hypothetical protein
MPLRSKLLWLGLITFIGFPVPTIVVLHFFNGVKISSIFQPETLSFSVISKGLVVGALTGILIYIITRISVFREVPLKVEEIIQNSNLSIYNVIFLSLAAGFGEELLFRAGVQYFFGVIPTSILFVALHGYFSIKNPKVSLYGLIVLPFILILGYGFIHIGLWFSISAHFSYDLLLFLIIIKQSRVYN